MPTRLPISNVGYGLTNSLQQLSPLPIKAQRAPTTSDTGYELGTIWLDMPNLAPYILVSVTAASANWVGQSGGSGTFTSVTVNPGDLDVTAGDTTLGGTLDVVGATTLADVNIVGNLTLTGDFDITDSGSIGLTSTNNAAGAITLTANGGTSETILVRSLQGTGVASINLASTSGGLTLTSGLASADAININASVGGVDIDGALQISLSSTQNDPEAILIDTSVGGIHILSVLSTVDIDGAGLVSVSSSLNAAQSVLIEGQAGGVDILATGTAGEDIDLIATGSSVNITATENVADSIVLSSTNGGIDILAAGAAAGEDIDIIATGSSINITSTEDNAGAIYIRENAGTSGRVRVHADQGTGVDSVFLQSDVGGITLNGGLATADAINIITGSASGGIDIDAGSAGIDMLAVGGKVDIDAEAASHFTVTGAATDLLLNSVGGSVNISATESAADSVVITSTAGGIDILASGASAGEDIDIVATGSSVNITSTEADANAIVISASNAAGNINLNTAGGNVVATGGNVIINSAAKQLQVQGGAVTDFIGTATLTNGTTGAIANTNIAAGDRIFIQRTAVNASSVLGMLVYSISAATSFTITSRIVGTPGSNETNDQSSLTYFIVREI